MLLEQVLENIGVGRYQFLQCFLLGGLWLVDGAEMLVSSSILGALQDDWHLSSNTKGLMMSVIFVGVAAGGLVGGRLADVWGRRRVTLVSFVGEIVFGAISATAQGPGFMLLTRFFIGFTFGAGIPAIMAVTLESAPEQGGKHLLNLGCIWFGLGEVYAATLLMIYMPMLTDPTDFAWREVVVLTMVPAMLLLPGLALTLQESPGWLLANGHKREALSVLKFIANFNHCEEVVQQLQDIEPCELVSEQDEASSLLTPSDRAGSGHGSTSSSSRAAAQPLEEPPPAGDGQEPPEGSAAAAPAAATPLAKLTVSQLLTFQEFRWTLIAGAWLCFVANFLFYGTSYLLPTIFRSLGTNFSPAMELLIAAGASFPGVAIGDMLLQCRKLTDRDRLVILSAAVGTIEITLSHLDAKSGNHGQLILIMFCLLKMGLTAFFNLAYVFIGRVFPSACRCTAMSFCITGGRFGSISAPLVCELLIGGGGRNDVLYLFCTMLCIMTMLVIRFMLGEYDQPPELEPEEPEPKKPLGLEAPAPSTGAASSSGQPTLHRRISRRISGGSLALDLPAATLESLGHSEAQEHPLAHGLH